MNRILLVVLLSALLVSGIPQSGASAPVALADKSPTDVTGKNDSAPHLSGAAEPFSEDWTFGRTYVDFTAWGDYVYYVEPYRLRILSYANPTVVELVSEISFTSGNGSLRDVEVSPDGSRLIVQQSINPVRLLLYDISNPTAPQLLSEHDWSVRVEWIQVLGNRLYTIHRKADYSGYELHIYRWDTGQLQFRGVVDAPFGRLFLDGNTLALAPFTGGSQQVSITLVDVSDDTAPRIAATIPSSGGVAIPANGHLYVVNFNQYTDIWDIRDPYNPRVVAVDNDFAMQPVANRGSQLLFQGSGNVMALYDVSTPTVLREIGATTLIPDSQSYYWTENRSIYFRRFNGGVPQIQRATYVEPFQVELAGRYTVPVYHTAMTVADRYLYLYSTSGAGIEIVDMQNPHQPRTVATALRDVVTWVPEREYLESGQRLYVNYNDNLLILDTSDPLRPTVVATRPLVGDWVLESISDGYLYALQRGGNNTLELRLSDLEQRTFALLASPACTSLSVEHGVLSVLCGSMLHVATMPPEQSPAFVASIPLPKSAYTTQSTLIDEFRLLITSDDGLLLYDISNPAAPQQVGTVPNPGDEGWICPHLTDMGGHIYVHKCYPPFGSDYGPARIVDVSVPANPQFSTAMSIPDAPAVALPGHIVIAREYLTLWHMQYPDNIRLYLPSIWNR